MFHREKCIGCGRCHGVAADDRNFVCYQDAREICGKEYTVEEVFHQVARDQDFYENSGGGVTFSGGECMLQPEVLTELLAKCKEAGIHTAVDTAGNVDWEIFERVLPFTDLFLYDLKAYTETLHLEGTGVPNERILKNLCMLSDAAKAGRTKMTVRIPVVGGYNDSPEEMQKMADFLHPLCIEKTELLAYHGMAKGKYEALGMPFTEYRALDDGTMKRYRLLFSRQGEGGKI